MEKAEAEALAAAEAAVHGRKSELESDKAAKLLNATGGPSNEARVFSRDADRACS